MRKISIALLTSALLVAACGEDGGTNMTGTGGTSGSGGRSGSGGSVAGSGGSTGSGGSLGGSGGSGGSSSTGGTTGGSGGSGGSIGDAAGSGGADGSDATSEAGGAETGTSPDGASAPTPGAPCPACTKIFNGSDFDGWEQMGWVVQNGVMTVGSGANSRWAFSKGDYDSFRLIVSARMEGAWSGNLHLGILFWGERPAAGSYGLGGALQVQPPHGAMWDYSALNRAPPGKMSITSSGPRNDNNWSVTEILADIKTGTLRVAINGKEIFTYKDRDPTRLKKGPVGVQDHGGMPQYKDIFIEANPTENKLYTVK